MNQDITLTLTDKQAEVLYWALNSTRVKWSQDIVSISNKGRKKNAETIEQWTAELNNVIDIQNLIPASAIKL